MPRPNPTNKAPDPTSVRVARSKRKAIEAGMCRNGIKHGPPRKGVLCLRCWAVKNARRLGMTVEQLIENESGQLAQPGTLTPLPARPAANDQMPNVTPSSARRR